MVDWNAEARRLLRAELARRGVSYKKLVLLLEGIGVAETERAIANKLSRGTFSFAFFIQCMKALGCERVEVSLREIDISRLSAST